MTSSVICVYQIIPIKRRFRYSLLTIVRARQENPLTSNRRLTSRYRQGTFLLYPNQVNVFSDRFCQVQGIDRKRLFSVFSRHLHRNHVDVDIRFRLVSLHSEKYRGRLSVCQGCFPPHDLVLWKGQTGFWTILSLEAEVRGDIRTRTSSLSPTKIRPSADNVDRDSPPSLRLP